MEFENSLMARILVNAEDKTVMDMTANRIKILELLIKTGSPDKDLYERELKWLKPRFLSAKQIKTARTS